jgi:aminocarboxymuconate-semialdehyde decarboxylase
VSIDIHSHIMPEEFLGQLAAEVPSIAPRLSGSGAEWYLEFPDGPRSGPVPRGMFDVGERLAEMDHKGVDMQALSVSPTSFGYQRDAAVNAIAVRLHNDAMVELVRAHPTRFTVLAGLPMQDIDASLEELERVAKIPEIAGLQIGTNVNGDALGSARFAGLWSAIDAAGLAVILHPTQVAGIERMRDFYLQNFVGNPMESTLAAGSLIMSGTLARNSALRIALLHGGGFLPYQIGRFDHGWRVRPESRAHTEEPPSSFLGRFWFDTLTHDPASLRFLYERVGAERLALGSDYPFDMAPVDPVGEIRAVFGDEPEVMRDILETTPRALLSRETSR